MSQDVVSDALNKIMNAKRAKKKTVQVRRYSKFLLDVLELAKREGYLGDIKINEKEKLVDIKLAEINECKSIKPRFFVAAGEFEKYIRRFLPARDFGILIVSTNKGLLIHSEAIEQNIGGALIAFFY